MLAQYGDGTHSFPSASASASGSLVDNMSSELSMHVDRKEEYIELALHSDPSPSSRPMLDTICASTIDQPKVPRIRLTFKRSASTAQLPAPERLGPMPPVRPSVRLVGGGHARKSHPREAAKSARRGHASSSTKSHLSQNGRRTRSNNKDRFTNLEDIELEAAAVKEEVARLGLSLRDVEGDGNCLFRALSDQLWGDPTHHSDLRRWTCDWIVEHSEEMADWFPADDENNKRREFEKHVERMRQAGTYGTHVEVSAAARMLERDIRIISSSHSTNISASPSPRSTASPADPSTPVDQASQLPSTPRRRTRSSSQYPFNLSSIPSPRSGHSKLWLALFSDAEHYQSIRLAHVNGASQIPDTLAQPHRKDVSESARIERGELSPIGEEVTDTVETVLRAMPVDHRFTAKAVQNVLGRTRGDVDEAIEILLDEYNCMVDTNEEEVGSIDTTDCRPASTVGEVEEMLVDSVPPFAAAALETVQLSRNTSKDDRYREPSPSHTKSTTSTEPHSPSGSTTTSELSSGSLSAADSKLSDQISLGSRASSGKTRSKAGAKRNALPKPYSRTIPPGVASQPDPDDKGSLAGAEVDPAKLAKQALRAARKQARHTKEIAELETLAGNINFFRGSEAEGPEGAHDPARRRKRSQMGTGQ